MCVCNIYIYVIYIYIYMPYIHPDGMLETMSEWCVRVGITRRKQLLIYFVDQQVHLPSHFGRH